MPFHQEDPSAPAVSPRKLRVGVVDDNRSVAEIITEVLGNRDFECFDAYDGRGALDLVAQKNIDLLILDFLLPDVDGYEVVRQLESKGKTVPTLIITGAPKEPPEGWASLPSVRGVIRKPFTGAELRRAVYDLAGLPPP